MKNDNKLAKIWRYIIISLAFIYLITLIVFVYTIRTLPEKYSDAQVKDDTIVENYVKKAIDDGIKKEDFEQVEIDNNAEFVIAKDGQIIYSTLPIKGVVYFKDNIDDTKLASERFFAYKGYDIWYINYYLSPQTVFNNWITMLFGLLLIILTVIFILIIIVYRKFIYPLKRLKENILRLSQYELNLLDNYQKSEYDQLSKQLVTFAGELEKYLEKSTLSYTALENKLQIKNEELEYRNQVVSTMTHDLKAPLNTVKLIAEELAHENKSKLIDNIKDITMQAINDINNIGQIAYSAEDIIKNEEIDLIKELLSIYASYKLSFSKKNLKVEIDTDFELVVCINKIRFKQLVHNALSNISNYALENGEVVISCYREDNKIILSFYNDAHQMSQQQLESVFDLFYRISNDEIGSGTGLYTIRNIAHELNGEATMSNVKNGVELKIILGKE